MNINIILPLRLMIRLVRAVEKLASDYATVHALELNTFQYKPKQGEKIGHTYYQDDKKIYEAEVQEKLRTAGLL